MFIDFFLPRYDVTARYELHINASIEHVYTLVRTLDVSQSNVIKFLFAIRSLPSFFRKLNNKNSLGLSLEGLLRNGFVLLQEDPPTEIVLGLVGKFWTFSGCIQRLKAEDFVLFDKTGFAKAVWNFHITLQSDGRALLSTETRVQCTDDKSRKRFLRYWFVIGPFSGLIRNEALRIIKQDAERKHSAAATHIP